MWPADGQVSVSYFSGNFSDISSNPEEWRACSFTTEVKYGSSQSAPSAFLFVQVTSVPDLLIHINESFYTFHKSS